MFRLILQCNKDLKPNNGNGLLPLGRRIMWIFSTHSLSVGEWMIIDDSGEPYEIIARKNSNGEIVKNIDKWNELSETYK